MKKYYLIVLAAMALFCSCEPNVNSGEFDSPFPFEKVDAYFEWPFDTAVFVSNTGDTMVCTAQGEPGHYYFFEYEVEFDWQEPEKEEVYERRLEYLVNNELAFFMSFEIKGRKELAIRVSRRQGYLLYTELRQPSDKIFDFLTDTIVLYNKNLSLQNYATIVNGKGVVEMVHNDGEEVWHLVE